MTCRKSRAELEEWLVTVDRLLIEEREHAISPSTVPPATDDTPIWTMRLSTFQRDLKGLIDLLVSSPGRWVFILEPVESDRYLQMLVYEDGSIFAEAVSNYFLEGPDRLSVEEEAALGVIGWNEPRLPDKPNWWAVHATLYPDTSTLASLVLWTLGLVYGLYDTDLVTGKLFDSPRRGDTPASNMPADWLMMESDVEGEEDYTGETAYWTAEELETKSKELLEAIAHDLDLEVPRRATKAQLLDLILGEAEE